MRETDGDVTTVLVLLKVADTLPARVGVGDLVTETLLVTLVLEEFPVKLPEATALVADLEAETDSDGDIAGLIVGVTDRPDVGDTEGVAGREPDTEGDGEEEAGVEGEAARDAETEGDPELDAGDGLRDGLGWLLAVKDADPVTEFRD